LKLGSFPKLAMRYGEPFDILKMICLVAYMLALPTSMRIHNAFHVSLFKKYVLYLNHVIDWNVIQVEHKGDFQVEQSSRTNPLTW
jgi:ABC-type antimicrobial peptide transport system permease subunit